MRIGIDVRYLSHALVGGVHTYVAHIVPALAAAAAEHDLYLYADTKRPFELEGLPAGATVRLLPWRSPLSSVYHDLFLWRQMRRDRLDVAHFPANYGFAPRGCRAVLTVHDAINLLPLREIVRGHRKTARTVSMMTYLHLCTRQAVRRASLVLTVSDYARSEIARHGGVDPAQIVAIPHGRSPDLRRVEDPALLASVRRHYGLAPRFILADALKNPGTLVRAWPRVPARVRASCEIVFFSRRADPPPAVQEAVDRGHARLLVRPPREDLIALYSMADAFVFPSWIEGFGIPILEAMTCGAPVIASDRGAIPEVAGNAALLADAEDASALAQHISSVLGSPATARSLRERGFARAARFSWDTTARQTLASYDVAMRSGRPV